MTAVPSAPPTPLWSGAAPVETTVPLINDNPRSETYPFIDLRPPLALTIITAVACAVLQTELFLVLFIGSASYLAGRVVKKIADSYDIMRQLEELGLKCRRKIPYLHIVAVVLMVVFAFIILALACVLASTFGLFNAVTIDTASYNVSAERPPLNQGFSSLSSTGDL